MKFKITFFDLLIVVFILLFCTVLFFRMPKNYENGSKNANKHIEITVKTDCSENYIYNLSMGDPIVDANSGKIIGRVSGIEYYDYNSFHIGLGKEVVYPEHKVAKITFSSMCEISGDFISISDTRIVIGESYSLVAPKLAFDGVCISVKESDLPVGNINAPYVR